MAIDASLVGARGTSSGSSVTTTGGSTSTGDTLVAVVSYDAGTTISSISDTAGNTYTLAVNNTGGFAKLAVYYCENATGNASNVLTVNFSGAAFPTAHLIKVTGAAAASYDSGSLVSTAPTVTPPWTVTNNTLAQAASVLITCTEGNRNGANGAYAIGGSFTLLSQEPDAVNFWTSAVAKLVVASTAGVTATWSKTGEGSSGVSRGAIILAFKEATGPAAPVLSAPTPSGTLGTSTTATVGATTDQNTGTLYVVADSAAALSGVTVAQVKAGQKSSGAAAAFSGNAAVSTTSPSVGLTGLSPSTPYSYAIAQNNANGDSNLVTGTFTTAGSGGGGGAVDPDPITACFPIGYYE